MDKVTQIPSLDDLGATGLSEKTIFIRVDFNVPMVATDKGYRVLDDTRIRRFLDTTFRKIHDLTQGRCRIIIGSHLGRPHKRKGHEGWDGIFNMQYVCSHFDTLIRKQYGDIYSIFPPEITDEHLIHSLDVLHRGQMPLGGIKFLPNLRYLLDPTNPDTYREEFIRDVAQVSDVFINCAFGCSHRMTKSIKMLPQIMRNLGKSVVGGALLREEIERLGEFGRRILESPETTAVVAGGTKIADKIGVLKAFVQAGVKLIFIGGRMVNAFLLAKSFNKDLAGLVIEDIPRIMWESKNDEDRKNLVREIQFAGEIIEEVRAKGVALVYPDDYKITKGYFETDYVVKSKPDFETDFQLDLGPETIENFYRNILREGEIKNVFWNGPLGAYDHPKCGHYAEGSVQLSRILFAATLTDKNLRVVVGGGDSAAVLNKLDPKDLQNLILKQLNRQINPHINHKLFKIELETQDTYTLCNYLTSNFFVSTGGGASLEFIEKCLQVPGGSEAGLFLPATSILFETLEPLPRTAASKPSSALK